MYCRNCGNKLEETAQYCNKCGNQVNQTVVQTNGKSKKFTLRLVILVLLEIFSYLPGGIVLLFEDSITSSIGEILVVILALLPTILYIVGIIILDLKVKLENKGDYLKTNLFSVLISAAPILILIIVLASTSDESVGGWLIIFAPVMLISAAAKYFVINLIVDSIFSKKKNN